MELLTVKYQLPQTNQYCKRCPELVVSRKRVTFGYGNPASPIMFIGEAPGMYGCDITGIPFTGDKSGEYFQRMLKLVGWSKEDIYTTNVVKCCPPENREPTDQEILNCKVFLDYEIETVKPKYIILMGKSAMNAVLQITGSVINNWDKIRGIGDWRFITIPHPAYIARNTRRWEKDYIASFVKIRKLIENI